MIYDLPSFNPPALLEGEQAEPIKRKRGRNRHKQTDRQYETALMIGMIFLMDDGTLCRVVQVEPELLCYPIKPQDRDQ